MTVSPLFSVVIPCYERAATVLPTLESVRRQTLKDFECVVVDDGSSDVEELAAVIESLADSRFRLIRRSNGGGGAARNTGVEVSRGRFVAFLDSDDLFLENKLQRFASEIEYRHDRAWYSQALVDRGGLSRWPRPSRAIRHDEDMGEYLFVQNEFVQTSTIVLTASLARRIPFDPTLRKGQDLDLCLRLHAGGVRFAMLKDPLSVWVDRTEAGRTSRVSGHEAPLAWLERARPLLTIPAQRGYRATTLAYFMAKDRPFMALRDILVGWALAGVPSRVALRQILRCFLPRRLYREAVNAFVAIRGVRAEQ